MAIDGKKPETIDDIYEALIKEKRLSSCFDIGHLAISISLTFTKSFMNLMKSS